MRKIKTFRVFEKSDEPFFTDEEKIEIEDICQELKDSGFNIAFNSGMIRINKLDSSSDEVIFTLKEEIFETIKRLEDYLDRRWFEVYVVLSDEMDMRKILMDESSHRAFLMSDKESRYKEKLLGGPMTRIKRLIIEI